MLAKFNRQQTDKTSKKRSRNRMLCKLYKNKRLNERLYSVPLVVKKIKQMRSWAKRIGNKDSLTECSFANTWMQIILLCTSRLLTRLPKTKNPRRLLSTEDFCDLTVIPLGFEPRTLTLKV